MTRIDFSKIVYVCVCVVWNDVLGIYCCVKNYPQTYWLETTHMGYVMVFAG